MVFAVVSLVWWWCLLLCAVCGFWWMGWCGIDCCGWVWSVSGSVFGCCAAGLSCGWLCVSRWCALMVCWRWDVGRVLIAVDMAVLGAFP